MMPKSKSCTRCGVEKPLEEFHRNKDGKFGRMSLCKVCKAEYYETNREQIRRYYEANREKILDQRRRYYEKNREKLLKYNRQYYDKYLKNSQ